MAETAAETASAKVVAREIVCPDGTQYTVYTDGTWDENAWDGSHIRDSDDYFAMMYAPEHRSSENYDALRQEVVEKLGL